jgi:Tol biopolymer transport system component
MTRIPGDPHAPARRRPSAAEATGPTPGSNDHPVPHRLRRRAVAGARSSGDGPKALFTAPTAISQPALSPDGTKLAFARLIDGFNNWDILLRNLTTGKTTTIADSPASDMYPSWSPDGSRIAFSSGRSGNVTQIYTMTPTGGTVTRIGYSGKPETMPAWSH